VRESTLTTLSRLTASARIPLSVTVVHIINAC